MASSYDSDVRKLDGEPMLTCENCGTFTLPLREYEISRSESPTIGAEWWEFLIYGWAIYLYNFVFDFFTYESRKKKLARLKRDVLTINPKSLICPACLRIKKRG